MCCALLATGGASLGAAGHEERRRGGRRGPPPPVSPPPVCRSVEALAAVLVPVAVHHHADDDEEDAAQHGEEYGEEYADGAHPFLDLAHWRRERGTRSQGAAGEQQVSQRQASRASLTSEQLDVVHAGQGDLLLLLRLFLLAAQHRQLVELQGDDVVVVCTVTETLRRYVRTFCSLSWVTSPWKSQCVHEHAYTQLVKGLDTPYEFNVFYFILTTIDVAVSH